MTVFLQSLMCLLTANVIKCIALLIIPEKAIGKSAVYAINIVLLLLTVNTAAALMEGVWNF